MFRLFFKFAVCCVICCAACSTSEVAAEADALPGVSTSKPNVIFIKTDGQRFDSLSMPGHPVTKTPNIGQLTTEGLFFDQAFITSPICEPSCMCVAQKQGDKKDAPGKLKIYYIRHAQAGHNVKADWEDRNVPKDQWPAYVGDPNVFTPKGLVQQAAVAEKLKKYDIDFIASSPMWRCQNTILPYMKETGSKGEVWPELREGRASALILDTDLPVPTEPILGAGKPLEVGTEEARYFSLREDGKNAFKVPRAGKGREADERSSAAARVVIQGVLDMVQTRFAGTDKSILFAGHGSSGKSVLRMLTQDPLKGFEGISNTGIWMVEEQDDGTFKLMMFNDKPVVNGKPTSSSSKHASMDMDNDGRVSKAEYVAKYARGFQRKDKNKDGFLSSDEHAHATFSSADQDKNGQLTRQEYSTIFERQFNTYDKNDDGVLTVGEMR